MNRDMNVYNYLHILEEKRDEYNINNELTEYINKNFNKMDKNDKFNILSKIYTDNKLDNEILKYELKYYKPENKKMNINEFLNETIYTLKKYHKKAGGHYIEDREWTITNDNDDCIVLINTIDIIDSHDDNTINFLEDITKRLNNISYYNVKYEIDIDKEYKIGYVNIIINKF